MTIAGHRTSGMTLAAAGAGCSSPARLRRCRYRMLGDVARIIALDLADAACCARRAISLIGMFFNSILTIELCLRVYSVISSAFSPMAVNTSRTSRR